MDADGSNLLNLSSAGFSDHDVAWSPDGKHLAVNCNYEEQSSLCVLNSDGSGRKVLADYNSIPYWSPDSTKIAFGEINTGAIIVVNADGTGLHRITEKRGDSLYLAWSHDSTKIAFRSGDHDSDLQAIFAANADGSGETQLTKYETVDDWPVWSPDGQEVAFESKRDGKSEIYMMNADGTDQVRLTYTSENSFQPQWSPDGTRIAFESRVNGVIQIFIMNADGSGVSRLTWDEGHKCCFSWKP
jgi:TolB protein